MTAYPLSSSNSPPRLGELFVKPDVETAWFANDDDERVPLSNDDDDADWPLHDDDERVSFAKVVMSAEVVAPSRETRTLGLVSLAVLVNECALGNLYFLAQRLGAVDSLRQAVVVGSPER